VQLLTAAGFLVEDKTGIGGSPAARAALEGGEIDLYPEYTGTGVTLFHNLPVSGLPSDAERLFVLAQSLDAPKGLTWLDRAPLNNTYTLMVTQKMVDQGVRSIVDLANFMNSNDAPLKICIESEFYGRAQDGLLGLQQRYGFAFKEENVLFMDLNETYNALRDGDCEVAEGFATDGRINAWGFFNLEDTLSFFPIYNPAPVIRQDVLALYPEIEGILNQLAGRLTTDAMSKLNGRVDLGADGVFGSGDEESAEEVALNFLQEMRLIAPPSITVGSKEFTEQLLLGKMLVLLLQDAGYAVVDKTGLGGSPAVRAALESGEIDLYPEYTGTTLSLHHGLPSAALPTDPVRAFELAKSLDARNNLVWLQPAPLNDTYTLMARQELAEQGISTIAELAAYMNANDSPFTLCIESEFYSRSEDGIGSLQERYGFRFKEENMLIMDLNEIYESLRAGDCDLGEGYSTDGRIDAWGFFNLTDTLAFFPIYNPAPVLRQELLQRHPELEALFNQLTPHLDNASMSKLNARVDLGADGVSASGDEESVEQVAYSFLRSRRLLKPPQITVASEEYTEQLILGNMLTLLLQQAGYGVNDKLGIGGTPLLRQAMLDGEVDVYVELTGQAVSVHHSIPSDALPTTPARVWALARTLDAKHDLVWLPHGPFNDTYGIMVRDDLWNQNIRTLDDLAAFMNDNDSPLTICLENDFFARQFDGFPILQQVYGFSFKPEKVLLMELAEVYNALRNQQCDVGEGYTTDGRGAAWGFHNLADTRSLFPIYNPAPVLRRSVLDANPDLADLLGSFLLLLDNQTMSQLNARVDIGPDREPNTGDEESPQAVARTFLTAVGLLANPASASQPPANPPADPPAPPHLSPITISPQIPPTTAISVSQEISVSEEISAAGALAPLDQQPVVTNAPTASAVTEDDRTQHSISRVTSTSLIQPSPVTAGGLLTNPLPLLAVASNALINVLSITVPATLPAFPLFPGYALDQAPITLTNELSSIHITSATAKAQSDPITATLIPTATLALSISQATPINPLLRVIVSTPASNSVNARIKPNTQAEVLDLLPPQTLVPAIARTVDSAWLHIILPDGRQAWVFSDAVLHRKEAIDQLPVTNE
jgi:glycine betaine/choline ABC-type transport system substrate-binding protein